MPAAWPAGKKVAVHPIRLIGRPAAAVTGPGRPAAVTIAGRAPRRTAVLTTFCLAIPPGLQVTQDSPALIPRGHVLAAAAYLVIAATVSAWEGWRGWRMGLRLDDHGVTIRNFFRTYQFGWPQVDRFTDGSANGGNAGRVWALSIVLRDGRAVTATATSSGKRDARPQTLTTITQAAERWAVPAQLTGTARKPGSPHAPANPGRYRDPGGQPGTRHWDGSGWSPFLQPDAARGGSDGAKAPAEVWSPVPGSEHQWHDAAARARKAGIVCAAWLAVTAAATAVTIVLYARPQQAPGRLHLGRVGPDRSSVRAAQNLQRQAAIQESHQDRSGDPGQRYRQHRHRQRPSQSGGQHKCPVTIQ
jgi:hypothetical protein